LGWGRNPFQREADQAVISSASFLPELLVQRQTSMIDVRRASTAFLNLAIVMQSGGIRTTTSQIDLVSRPWRRASMQVAAAISAREVSIPAKIGRASGREAGGSE